MSWDPGEYLRFTDHRLRPGLELMARIPELDARRVIDLGCGTGALTRALADRWPVATVVGVDASPDMLSRARVEHPALEWIEADIGNFEPDGPVDVVYSNAALHWLDHHETLIPHLRTWLRPGGVLAIQMPNNWAEPTHTIPAAILDTHEWAQAGRSKLPADRLADPRSYAEWAQPAETDLWETIYHHRLTGDDPVLGWVSGSVLRPVLDALGETAAARFADECRREYARAYPPDGHGVTTLAFRRMFLVAVAR
jgi:trans-aconitate 2-methyltransferase